MHEWFIHRGFYARIIYTLRVLCTDVRVSVSKLCFHSTNSLESYTHHKICFDFWVAEIVSRLCRLVGRFFHSSEGFLKRFRLCNRKEISRRELRFGHLDFCSTEGWEDLYEEFLIIQENGRNSKSYVKARCEFTDLCHGHESNNNPSSRFLFSQRDILFVCAISVLQRW